MAKSERIKELEQTLAKESQDRAEAEDRASRAKDRAVEAEEAHRKLQLAVVAAQDEALAAKDEAGKHAEKVSALEKELILLREAHGPASTKDVSAPDPVDETLARVRALRSLMNAASEDLAQLIAEDNALAEKRARFLGELYVLLGRVIGESRQAPPPLPALSSAVTIPKRRSSTSVDISEIAELIESLRPPPTPKE